jgi:hypothetical protein
MLSRSGFWYDATEESKIQVGAGMHGLRPYRRKRRRRRMQKSLGPSLLGQAAGEESNLLLAPLNVINQVPCTCITLRERRSRQARLANMGLQAMIADVVATRIRRARTSSCRHATAPARRRAA